MVGRILSFIAFFGIVTCCTGPIYEPVDHTRFYPVQEGNVWVYEVNETRYAAGLEPQERTYYYKETIGKAIDENTFILQRAQSDNGLWKPLTSIFIKANLEGVTIIDGDKEEEVIKYPLYEGASWQVGEENYQISTLDYSKDSEKGRDLQLNRVEVQMANDSSAINLRRRSAQFEIDKGLTYRLKEEYAYCQENPNCIGKGIISSGIKEIVRLDNTTGYLPNNNSSRSHY